MVRIEAANSSHLGEVLGWLQLEEQESGEGFFCNQNVIANAFASGSGICAVSESGVSGFAVIQVLGEGGDIHIIEVKPVARGRGLGARLLLAAIELLRELGAKFVDVECTSRAGEALCRKHGFEDYSDSRNYQSEWDNPTLRLYLSAWRPKARHPWA